MTILSDSEKQRLQQILGKATGPAPWYWKTFPSLRTGETEFEWVHHGEDGALAYLVTLYRVGQRSEPLLALNTYCTPFALGEGRLGIWCPEGRGMLRLVAFDVDQLKPFVVDEIVGWFKQSTERIFSKTEPVEEFEFSAGFPQGTQALTVPEAFHPIPELLMVAARKALAKEDPACAVFVLYPQAGLVEVLPQRWFNRGGYDVGQQWITRVVRDPVSHRIIGDGFRMPPFRLSENGLDLDGLLE